MPKKDKNYRDFSNRTAFNGRPVLPGQILIPVVLNKDMAKTLKPAGLNYDYTEGWRFPYASETVPVAFVPIDDAPGVMENYMKIFHKEADNYLKHVDDTHSDELSLNKMLDDIENDDENGFDPTGTTENEDKAFLAHIFDMLVEDLNAQDPNMGRIISLLADGFQKNEIIDKIDLGKGKSQAYAFIEKTQKAALKIYDEKYRY